MEILLVECMGKVGFLSHGMPIKTKRGQALFYSLSFKLPFGLTTAAEQRGCCYPFYAFFNLEFS
jgi:hypothetical protein